MNKDAVVIHLLRGGRPRCGFTLLIPAAWPEGHRWTGYLDEVTCPNCRDAFDPSVGSTPMNDEEKQKLRQRYLDAAHKMQTGVGILMERDREQGTSPKHLRVGVNSAMSDQGGLAQLLIRKGLITEEEYYVAMAEAMEREADGYEKRVQAILGPKVTLG